MPVLPILLAVIFAAIGIAWVARSSVRMLAGALLVSSIVFGYVAVYALVALVPSAILCR